MSRISQARPGNDNAQGRRNAEDNPGNPSAKLPTHWQRHAAAARRHPLDGDWTKAHVGIGATISGIMATTDGPIGWALLPESHPRYDPARPFVATIDGRPSRLASAATPAEAQAVAEKLRSACGFREAGWAAVRARYAA